MDLRNAVDLLEFSEAYCAEQLKKTCLQFICVNAACFLEGRWVVLCTLLEVSSLMRWVYLYRYLDGLDVSLLDELSATYISMVGCVYADITFAHIHEHISS